ncbi:MAG: histidine phosphatase family protein [Ignavibacteria bacterium]
MKIGLLRHFKVKLKFPGKVLVTYDEVFNWYEKYGTADIEVKHVDLSGGDWKKCYASPLFRAKKTTEAVYKKEVSVINELKELDVLPLLNKKRRMPFIFWGLMLKIKSTQRNYITDEFESKISAFLDQMLKDNSGDVLIISHGFVMTFIQKELKKKGFKGASFLVPNYNRIYIYEKK